MGQTESASCDVPRKREAKLFNLSLHHWTHHRTRKSDHTTALTYPTWLNATASAPVSNVFPMPLVLPDRPVPLDTFVRSLCMDTNAGRYSFAMVLWAPNDNPHASVLAVLYEPDQQVLHWRLYGANQPFDGDKEDSLLSDEYNTSYKELCTWLHHQLMLMRDREYHPPFSHLSIQRTRCRWHKRGATQSLLENSLWRVPRLYGGLCVLIVLALLLLQIPANVQCYGYARMLLCFPSSCVRDLHGLLLSAFLLEPGNQQCADLCFIPEPPCEPYHIGRWFSCSTVTR